MTTREADRPDDEEKARLASTAGSSGLDRPVPPEPRDAAPGRAVEHPETLEEQAEVRDALYNRPGEGHYTESDLAEAKRQRELGRQQDEYIRTGRVTGPTDQPAAPGRVDIAGRHPAGGSDTALSGDVPTEPAGETIHMQPISEQEGASPRPLEDKPGGVNPPPSNESNKL